MPRLDWVCIFAAVGAVIMGILTLYGGGGFGETLAIKKIIWLILGLILMFSLSMVNYQRIGFYSVVLYAIGIFLLLMVLVPFLGTKVKGARSWIRFFGFGFQPAEYMKLALVIMLSRYIILRENEIGKLKELIIPFLLTIIPVSLIIIQPDLGSAVLFLPILFSLLFIGGANTSVIFGMAIIGFATLFIPMYLEYHKYILVDDIYEILIESNYKLAEAVRFLNFEVWQAIDKAKSGLVESGNWAENYLSQPENFTLLTNAVQIAFEQKSNFFRDLFSNDMANIILISIGTIAYGISLLAAFMSRYKGYRKFATVSLIFTLSIASAFSFRKFVSFKPHQVVRIVSFANPDKFPKGAGYQLRHALITVGSGKLMGKGMSQGDMTRGETPYLPEWYNDFIFAVIGEQFGFFGVMFTLILLFTVILRGIQISLQSKDDFGSMLAGGITALFFFHIMINIGINIGLLPVTGITLTFVSAGGSNLLMSFAGLGILMNIYSRKYINA